MFYSQFILDKKGPLGTIWIAAHLERKLRKNQVADTDIGLSVDSILFPEVPIALRLSSHLLLGVVRIYSKKVNYLFHDCSEALVKIKQAFRSTAVDLPPEESTAPYNSITLPETFDLDNFELPESALLSSNFVDHHVSTKDQITLQDTVKGTSHPTSMFGLDERFGDGDASHIGLELEQELFMDKNFSPLHASFSIVSKEGGLLHGEPSLPSTSLGNDRQLNHNEGICSEIPNELSELLRNNQYREGFSSFGGLRKNEDRSHFHSYSIQTPDLNEVFIPDHQMAPSPYIALTPEEVQNPRLVEPAQGPSTPRLLEVIPSNFQEIPVLSPQERAVTPAEPGRPCRSSGPLMEVEYPLAVNETKHTDGPAMDHSLGVPAEGFSSSVELEQRSSSLALTHLDEHLRTHNSFLPSGTEDTIGKSTGNETNDLSVADQLQVNREVCLPSAISDLPANLDLHIKPIKVFGAEPISSSFSTDNVNKIVVLGEIFDEKTTAPNCTEPSNMSNPDHAGDIGSCLSRNTSAAASGFLLRPCSSNLPQDVNLLEIPELSCREQFPIREEAPNICESSREVEGDDFRSMNFEDSNLELKQELQYMSSGVKSGVTEPHELSACGPSNVGQPDCFNCSSSSEFVEPEKIVIPSRITDFPNDSGQQPLVKGVAESDGSVDRFSTISNVFRSNHLNNFSSSEFLEPEKMLNVDFTNDRGQQTAEKRMAESDGNIDRSSTLYSKKRRLMDNSTVQQTGTEAKLSGVPRSWRNAVPDDDDLLASILVGRKSQLLKIGTLLSPSTASSHKRPQTMPKFGMLKRRKVLVDGTVFLHADTIRQQLVNTGDIRRIRKKAPCTRPDIWRINIYEAEDEIFKNSVLTGATAELNSLEFQRYSPLKNQNSHVNTYEEVDPCRNLQFVNKVSAKVLGESVPTPLSRDHVGGENLLIINGTDMEHDHGDFKQLVVKEPLEQMSVNPLMEHFKEGQNVMMSEMEAVAWRDSHLRTTNAYITENAESSLLNPLLEKHDNENINESMISEMEADPQGGFHLLITESYIADNAETCLALEKPPDENLNIIGQSRHHECRDHQNTPLGDSEHISMETKDVSAAVFMDSECLIRAEDVSNAVITSSTDKDKHVNAADMENSKCRQIFLARGIEIDNVAETIGSAHKGGHILVAENEGRSIPDTACAEVECMASLSAPTVLAPFTVEENSVVEYNFESGPIEETIGLAPEGDGHNLVAANDGRSMPDASCAEVECMASLSAPTERAPFTVEENSVVEEYNLESGPIGFAGTRDSSDFCGAIDDNHAELLNVDAEADFVAEDGAPNPEATKLLESSGWSVRTRGVAKYLKNLFYEESVLGKKTVAVDRLLFGKTRKEASRLFFETLVLKSRDYILVEQETPFAYIKIKPRIKLLQAEF
ncbi:uncharacterized protein LOC110024393 isoform X2 [Phalaenopsis equestris]|uniref:uncharacterized protein LOC110024393 isoform X2 n=1 Tax=Phalaenopsis equestris TaxID=78828 RepID=UPI0009E27ED3|nr:uncharacterized protein LOC110024393 isoform X2 [Phalaenopsis equestris]